MPAADDYAKLRCTFEFLYERYVAPCFPNMPAEARPTAVLARQERESVALARRGLGMAINDMMEALRDLPPEEVAECDRALEAHGAYTLSALRHRHSRKYRGIVTRGAIRNDEEFYLAKGIAADTSLSLPVSERKLLAKLLHAYEFKNTGDNK